ncbi:MAG: hypothetical protein BM485_17485 [Desulfobulbaceae bacterium DB1]|nr:MAG: hypothetical protein BM485_17485 [Desulfobulbaceae bacterium DB1]
MSRSPGLILAAQPAALTVPVSFIFFCNAMSTKSFLKTSRFQVGLMLPTLLVLIKSDRDPFHNEKINLLVSLFFCG